MPCLFSDLGSVYYHYPPSTHPLTYNALWIDSACVCMCNYVAYSYFIQDYIRNESVAGPITTETRTLAINALTTLTYPLSTWYYRDTQNYIHSCQMHYVTGHHLCHKGSSQPRVLGFTDILMCYVNTCVCTTKITHMPMLIIRTRQCICSSEVMFPDISTVSWILSWMRQSNLMSSK